MAVLLRSVRKMIVRPAWLLLAIILVIGFALTKMLEEIYRKFSNFVLRRNIKPTDRHLAR